MGVFVCVGAIDGDREVSEGRLGRVEVGEVTACGLQLGGRMRWWAGHTRRAALVQGELVGEL